jgi:hypothetical protein
MYYAWYKETKQSRGKKWSSSVGSDVITVKVLFLYFFSFPILEEILQIWKCLRNSLKKLCREWSHSKTFRVSQIVMNRICLEKNPEFFKSFYFIFTDLPTNPTTVALTTIYVKQWRFSKLECFSNRRKILFHPGPNPTTSICNANFVKIYNATNSLARFERKIYFLQFKNALAYCNAGAIPTNSKFTSTTPAL